MNLRYKIRVVKGGGESFALKYIIIDFDVPNSMIIWICMPTFKNAFW